MTPKAPNGHSTVKKETMLIVVLISLLVGFLGGVMFSAYKSGSDSGQAPSSASRGVPATPSIPPALAQRMLSLEQAVAKDPADVESWTQLGHVYFDTDQFEQAIRAYLKSLELRPDNPDVLVDMGVMYRRSGQPEQAIASFDKAIVVRPEHETAWFNKGIVLFYDLGDREAAMQAWQQVLQINPDAKAGDRPLREMIENL